MRKKKKGGDAEKENEATSSKMLKGAERSAYFARREAAKVLKTVLEGDAKRRALASIKTLVYHPSVRNKKATFALICQTLKRNLLPISLFLFLFSIIFIIHFVFTFSDLPIINDVLQAAKILNTKWKVINNCINFYFLHIMLLFYNSQH